MRTFAPKQKPTQESKSSTSARSGLAFSEQRREVSFILHLQSSIGNHAAGRLLQGYAQSRAGDADEKEADEVARKIVDGESTGIRETDRPIDRVGESSLEITPEFRLKLSSSKGGGQPLDESTKFEMKSKMGNAFSDARVHTGSEAHGMSESINARAFTHGNDIYFKHGEYQPKSKQGMTLLVHELVHTEQQRGRANRGTYINRQVTENREDNPAVRSVYKKFKTKPYTVDTYGQDWHLYVVKKPQIKKAFEEEGTRVGIAPSELFVTAMGEGLGIFFDESRDENNEVSGFRYMGTDHFSSEFGKYKKYLPADYNRGDEFRESVRMNEKKQFVKSAVFKNLRVALTGLAAVYKYHRQLAISYGGELKYGQPTADQIHFWSYYFFQSPNGAKPVLRKNGGWDFWAMAFDKTSSHPSKIPSKCYKRVATWQYIKSKSIFSS